MEKKNEKGCCYTCDGTGTSCDVETNGMCWDCYGTGHLHETGGVITSEQMALKSIQQSRRFQD